MDCFTLSEQYHVVCRSEKTRYGFRHLASLKKDSTEVAHSKACYYNRSWEAYEYQTVIHNVIDKFFSPQLAGKYKKKVDISARGQVSKSFQTAAAVAKLGALLFPKQEEKNAFQQRIISTIPGIDFPEDFSSLSEAEKSKRLDGVIAIAGGV